MSLNEIANNIERQQRSLLRVRFRSSSRDIVLAPPVSQKDFDRERSGSSFAAPTSTLTTHLQAADVFASHRSELSIRVIDS